MFITRKVNGNEMEILKSRNGNYRTVDDIVKEHREYKFIALYGKDNKQPTVGVINKINKIDDLIKQFSEDLQSFGDSLTKVKLLKIYK